MEISLDVNINPPTSLKASKKVGGNFDGNRSKEVSGPYGIFAEGAGNL